MLLIGYNKRSSLILWGDFGEEAEQAKYSDFIQT